MARSKYEKDISDTLKQYKEKNWHELYKDKMLNWRTDIKLNNGNKIKSNEYIAKILCNKEYLNKFNRIEEQKREYLYKQQAHNGHSDIHSRIKKFNYLNYNEKNLAIAIYNNQKFLLGKIIDYELPLKADRSSTKDGDIDLISQTETATYLIELKRKLKNSSNDETLLRALLEICTYYKRLQHNKFKTEYGKQSIKLCILVEKGSYAYNQAIDNEHNVNLFNLINKLSETLQVEIFICAFAITPKIDFDNAFDFIGDTKKALVKFKKESKIKYEHLYTSAFDI